MEWKPIFATRAAFAIGAEKFRRTGVKPGAVEAIRAYRRNKATPPQYKGEGDQ